MKILRPSLIVAGDIVSTTAVETVAAYNAGTTYALGDQVIFGNFIFESLQAGNTGNQPDISPTFWLLVGPSNTWAMFDTTVSTQTVAASPLTVVVDSDEIVNTLALLNITGAQTCEVIIRDVSGTPEVVYSVEIDLDDSTITDWYEYFFADFELKGDVVLTNLPPFPTVEIEVSLSGAGDVAVGVMQIGTSFDVGQTQQGVNFGIRDYSVKQTDDFGSTIFVERDFSKRLRPNVFCENSRIGAIFRSLSSIRAVPTVFIPTEADGYDALIVYGFLRDWNLEVPYPENSLVSMEIEGLI